MAKPKNADGQNHRLHRLHGFRNLRVPASSSVFDLMGAGDCRGQALHSRVIRIITLVRSNACQADR